MSKLHIYGPISHHDHSFIVGTRETLKRLRDAIDSALAEGKGKLSTFTADGEGFELEVYREEEECYWDNALLPYTDEIAKDYRKDAVGPWDLFKKHKK